MLDPCPCCGSAHVAVRIVEEQFRYGAHATIELNVLLSAVIPVYECATCHEWWRDHEAETIIDEAIRYHKAAMEPFLADRYKLTQPKKHALIACTVDAALSDDLRAQRTYDVRYNPRNYFYSSVAGGQKCFTDADRGFNGEPIEGRVTYWIHEAGGFLSWQNVCLFLQQMRARDIEMMEYDDDGLQADDAV